MWGLEQSQAFLPAGSLTCFPLPRIQEMLFYLHTKRGPESTVKAQHFAMGHLPCPHITIYSRWFSSRILITSGPLNLIIFILPLTQPKVISTGRYHESCWVFPMKERSMIEVKKKKKKGALFNAGDKNQPHFTKYPMSLVKGEEIRSMTCGSICAEVC